MKDAIAIAGSEKEREVAERVMVKKGEETDTLCVGIRARETSCCCLLPAAHTLATASFSHGILADVPPQDHVLTVTA